MKKVNLLNLDRNAMQDFFVSQGEKSFRATQLLQWIHQHGITDFDAMTNLGKALRQRLQDNACIQLPRIITTQHSADGTRKWLLQLDCGNCIETVFIPEDDRNTLCVSSQVGCALDCSFCATAQQGFNRNLSTAEIIAQVWLAERELRAERGLTDNGIANRIVSNVVMMGMGEPLANFSNVISAIQLMLDDFCYGLSWRRVTLSTAGIVPAIYRLRDQCPVNLAVSLHAARDDLRDQLVPINRKYPLDTLLEACKAYAAIDKRRRITFEYILLKDINDRPADAIALIHLVRHVPCKINLIPFNPFNGAAYERSSPATIEHFRNLLLQGGLVTVTRKTRGDDIDAACGQLAGKVEDRSRRQARRTIMLKQEAYG